MSPHFQTAALRAAGLDVEYQAIDVASNALAETLRRLVAEGVGGNVTVPHKEAVARLCGRLTPLAERVGAVNTFWVEGRTLVGDNTDVGGFATTLTDLLGAPPPDDAAIAVLGAGGAAAAVLAALRQIDIRVWNRTAERARALCARLAPRARVVSTPHDAVDGASIVINATSIGLVNDAQPIALADVPPQATIVDLVYRVGETPWVRDARKGGHRAIDGLPMLLEQGALAFERWFGFAPDRAAMRRAVGD